MTLEMIQNRVAAMAADSSDGLGRMHAAGLPLVLPVRLQGALERPREPRSVDASGPSTSTSNEAIEKGWWDPRYAKAYQKVDAARAVRGRRQHAAPPARRAEAAAREPVAEAEDDRLGRLPPRRRPACTPTTSCRRPSTTRSSATSMPSVHHLNYVLCDRAAAPAGEALPDLEIGVRLAREDRGARRGAGHDGVHRRARADAQARGPRGARITLQRRAARRGEALRRGDPRQRRLRRAAQGHHARDAAREGLRALDRLGHRAGTARRRPRRIKPDEVHNPLRWHTEDKVPYDTLVRRAQFYIDHEWFLEAGEELPTHKEPPNQGGAKPALPDDQRPQPLEHPLDEHDQQHAS